VSEVLEESLAPPAELAVDLSEDEVMEAGVRRKQRVLGNVRLIAPLVTNGMLAPRVLISIAQELLKDPAAPDALESLAVLITAVGPTFDDKEFPHYSWLCSIFDKLDGLTRSKDVPARLRFLLRDVLDLRATSWENMKKATKKEEGPMKLQQVHRQAALEEKSKSLQNEQARGKATRKGNDKNLKDLKTVCESKPGSPKKQKIDEKEYKAKQTGHKKAPQVASPHAKTQIYGSAQPPVTVATPAAPFDLRAFRKQLNEVLKELGATRDTVSALRRLDGLKVPPAMQITEFMNLITRVSEERCGASRRVMFAFSASLAGKAFDHDLCAKGIKSFFDDVYEDLCEEVPRLPQILKNELVPTMSATLDADTLYALLPPALK